MFRPYAFLLIFVSNYAVAFADCVRECLPAECLNPALESVSLCKDSKMKCEIDCKAKPEEEQDLFTGIKLQSGNTMIMQGQKIAAGPAAFGGKLTPEDLAHFEKNVIYAKGADGTFAHSERKTDET